MKILFFAALRETMGQSEIELVLDRAITVGELKTRIKLPNDGIIHGLFCLTVIRRLYIVQQSYFACFEVDI